MLLRPNYFGSSGLACAGAFRFHANLEGRVRVQECFAAESLYLYISFHGGAIDLVRVLI